nr:3-methyl-2-oxobutanoate dehydrogenase (2-methylpropanoyl-transferring) subunit alpha [Oceanococcus sp. HetDA_MAG_MS8]
MTSKERPRLRLHIPEPKARPGESPDFSHIDIPSAGSLPRPAVDTPDEEMTEFAYGLIRVLDDNGEAVGAWDPQLPDTVLLQGLRAMLKTRLFDEAMLRCQRQGKTSFYMKCTGEEAVSVAQALAHDPEDMFFPSYRQQGLLVARDWPLVDLMCQIFNNPKDRTRGRQLPVLYSVKDANFFSISGNLGTQAPQAVGWAMASAYEHNHRIAAAWVGEGTTAEADFHNALTFASVYQAPVIINVVNNQWAISSFQGIAGGEQSTFAARSIGYGLAGLRVDGNDFLAVYAATQWACERARNNHGPTLIEHFTYRAAAHSTSDDPSGYRPNDEHEKWPLGDPIERLKTHLIRRQAWSQEQHQELEAELRAAIKADLKQAESYGTLGTLPDSPRSMFEDVFKDMPWHLREQRDQMDSL